MKQTQCEHCGDEVTIPDRGEYINPKSSAETRMEHFERTGHDIRKPPEPPEWHEASQ